MDLERGNLFTTSVQGDLDVGECRRKAVGLAKKLGFPDLQAGEIAIVTTELLTNVIRHGGEERYCVICTFRDGDGRKGLEIWCYDNGSGISSIIEAVRDGYSSKGSLGIGLGSILRLSDELDLSPEWPPEILASLTCVDSTSGTLICSRKWAPKKQPLVTNRNIVSGAASRPKPGEALNGDAHSIIHLSETSSLAVVIDGLGHGKEAHLASQLAKERILSSPDLPLATLLNNTHAFIRGTRGAVVGIAYMDTVSGKLSFSGIGNIEAHIISEGKRHYLLSLGGIVGHTMRTPRVFEHNFNAGDTLALYSDGITSSWQHEFDNWQQHPQKIAEEILETHSRQSDDATILIIRNRSPHR